MPRLIVTADVHGSYSTWLTLKELVKPDDSLVVAGDLFGTRYPRYGFPDYQPEEIKQDLVNFTNPFYFVYGNCDKQSFYPDQKYALIFNFMNRQIFLHHGDKYLKKIPANVKIIIQGHTHLAFLEKQNNIIFLNPGSLAAPRNSFYTYAVIEGNEVALINIKTGDTLASIALET